MGCNSSTPLVNGGGGLVENAKSAAADVMTSGENAMNGRYNNFFMINAITLTTTKKL
jgi:hypothetical protein